MSPGQTGHITGQMGRVPGTDGTHTRGCPAKILYVYWFFLSPTHVQILPLSGGRNYQNSCPSRFSGVFSFVSCFMTSGTPIIEARKGIPKNLSSQVFGEVRANFLGRIPTKTLHFVIRRSELFRKFLGRFRMILCY